MKVNNIKIAAVTINGLTMILLLNSHCCKAEKVYYKDGLTSEAKIVRRKGDIVWLACRSGSAGVDVKKISKIENDDGSISQYDYESLLCRVHELIKTKKYRESVGLFDVMLESRPDNAHIRYLRGFLAQKAGDLAKAAKDYEFLIRRGSADATVLNNLGAIYADLKRYGEAQRLFMKAVRKNPNMAEAHNNLAEVLMQRNKYGHAIKEYAVATKLEPENTKALYNLGVAYMRAGDSVRARAQWEKVMTMKPDDNDAKIAMGLLEKSGK